MTSTAPDVAPPIVHEVLRTSGRPLDGRTRTDMEARLGHDFSGVRVHADARAAESARAVGARAYSVGVHVVFGDGGYAPGSAAGARLLAHELAHVGQSARASVAGSAPIPIGRVDDPLEAAADRAAQSAMHVPVRGAPLALRRQPVAIDRAVCETTRNPPADDGRSCSYARPESCAAYEDWITTFTLLRRFRARARPGTTPDPTPSGPMRTHEFDVLGVPAPRPTATSTSTAPSPIGRPPAGERFIDHPTDQWVRDCLPANLRPTAYQLPSDCADIAVILRHVWLSAHGRQEKFGPWTIGDVERGPATARVGKIIDEVYTQNVASMVNPYSSSAGAPLRTFAELEPLLHPGDILVWEHRSSDFSSRTGGHTHTIASIDRGTDGRIRSFTMLQGNLPIFGEAQPPRSGASLDPSDDKGAILQDLGQMDSAERRKALGNLPGRRIEIATVARSQLQDQTVGTGASAKTLLVWNGHTVLVAAGPPRAAARPAVARGATRSVRDWIPAFGSALRTTVVGTAEAMLYEVRAEFDAGRTVSDPDARALGQAAGAAVWRLAKKVPGLAEEEHFQPLDAIQGMIESFARRAGTRTPALRTTLGVIRDAFRMAARGVDDLRFDRPPSPGRESIRVLLTGFDPFEPSGSLRRPDRGAWNASGAAVLALDGSSVPVVEGAHRAVAAVEGIVLPVSFHEFDEGVVERAVRSVQPPPDAVLSVSLGNVGTGGAVRLEQAATGTREKGGNITRTPTESGKPDGPPILRAWAPLAQIARETAKTKTSTAPEVLQPTIGEDITLRFIRATRASAAAAALGAGATATGTDVEVVGAAAEQLARLAQWDSGPRITFRIGRQDFSALLVDGPGGNFLSNEVSYRLLRMLRGGADPPYSFHVHTEAGDPVPTATGTAAERVARTNAVAAGKAVVTRLVTTLKSLVAAVGRAVLRRRHP